MKIAVIPNLTRARALEVTKNLCKELKKLSIDFCFSCEIKDELPFLEESFFEPFENLIKNSDMVISVGGDGSMLKAAKLAAKENKNVLGINAGRLAYLCGLDSDELHLLEKLLTEEYTVQHRMMLKADVFKENELIYSENCLNDAVFSRGANLRLIDLSIKTDGRDIADYLADGAIIATPTGSTAYSMSAGGPVIEPTMEAILLTPICPHSLAVRPIILSENSEIEVSVKDKNDNESEVFLSCDGQTAVKIEKDFVVKIKKSEMTVSLLSIKTDNFIDVLNKKLEK